MQNPSLAKILWEEFNPNIFSSKDTLILYLTGWSIAPLSSPVVKLSQSIAQNLKLKTIAIQTIPQKTMENSLFHEAKAIKDFIKNLKSNITKIILIAHSQGTIKTVHLANLFYEDKDFSLSGLIFITPVGLYELSKRNLQLRFFGEITKVLFTAIKEIIAKKQNKPFSNLTKAVIDFIRLKKKALRLNQQASELANSHVLAWEKLQKLNIPIAFILAEKDLVSSTQKVREALQKNNMKKVYVIESKGEGHGIPYTKTEMIVNTIENLIKKW